MAWTMACAGDISPDTIDGPPKTGSVLTTYSEIGTATTRVDASMEDAWVYLSLGDGKQVEPQTPLQSTGWDLSFQRFKVKSNGGISGIGAVEIAILPGADFDALREAPKEGYVVDQADSADEDEDEDYVLLSDGAWYTYNPTSHTLSPRDIIYVIHSAGGDYYKLQMLSYYDDAGTPGHPVFRWAAIAPPLGVSATQGLRVDAGADWVYVDLAAKQVIEVAEPSTSHAWDIAFNKVQIITNSGTSGSGWAGAQPTSSPWESLIKSPTTGFLTDMMIPVPGPPGSGEFSGNPVLNEWYDYDPASHKVSPKDVHYLVRTGSGDYAKLKIVKMENSIYTLGIDIVGREVSVITSIIDASDPEAWTHVSFRLGRVIQAELDSDPLAWDLALSRAKVRTNGGTSGLGEGAAADPGVSSLLSITTAPDSGYVRDEMLPIPGPPSSMEFSGSPILSEWYDYDPANHSTTPKHKAFVIRTADGGFVKLQFSDYDDGQMTIDWAYAGVGHESF